MTDSNAEIIVRGLAKIVGQLQTLITSLNDNTGQIAQCYKTMTSLDKRIRNLEQEISKIDSNTEIISGEVLQITKVLNEIKNSNILIQTNSIRLRNFLVKGEDKI